MMNSNNNGWDDEAAARKAPELYRCKGCGGTFYRTQVTMQKTDDGQMGVFYCKECIKFLNLRDDDCPFVTYDDPGQWIYLCDNCPIPDLVCELRNKAPLKVVKKR